MPSQREDLGGYFFLTGLTPSGLTQIADLNTTASSRVGSAHPYAWTPPMVEVNGRSPLQMAVHPYKCRFVMINLRKSYIYLVRRG